MRIFYKKFVGILVFIILILYTLNLKMSLKSSLPDKQVYSVKVPCLKNVFKDVVLVINFNYPMYDKNSKLLHEFYDGVFGKILTCGPLPDDKTSMGPDILYYEEKIWYFRYRCLSKAIEFYPGYSGI